MTLTILTRPNKLCVDSWTKLRMCGASIDSVLLAFTTSGGTPSGAIVVAIMGTIWNKEKKSNSCVILLTCYNDQVHFQWNQLHNFQFASLLIMLKRFSFIKVSGFNIPSVEQTCSIVPQQDVKESKFFSTRVDPILEGARVWICLETCYFL